jgi:general secretion pathway protein A
MSDSDNKAPEKIRSPLPKEPLVIRFKNDSNLFSIIDIERMKELVMILHEHPEATVKIIGYTDSIGDEGYNRKLSEFRANMVKSFLLGQNLPPENITTQGLGKENPVGRNDTAEGRTLNRRVEISIDTDR